MHLGGERHRVLSKNTTQYPRPGPEPGQLDPESSALTIRPPRLPLHHVLLVIHFALCVQKYHAITNLNGLPPEAGKGEFFSVKHRQPKLTPSATDTLPEEGSVVEMTKQVDTHQADSLLCPCPEDGCTKSYMTHGRLEQHLMYSKHEFRRAESLSLLDRAKVSYEVTIMGSEIHCGTPCLPEGWACRESAKPRHRFNPKQKRYRENFKMAGPRGSKLTQTTSQKR